MRQRSIFITGAATRFLFSSGHHRAERCSGECESGACCICQSPARRGYGHGRCCIDSRSTTFSSDISYLIDDIYWPSTINDICKPCDIFCSSNAYLVSLGCFIRDCYHSIPRSLPIFNIARLHRVYRFWGITRKGLQICAKSRGRELVQLWRASIRFIKRPR